MRVLFPIQPSLSHFHPIAPLAIALESAGHDVAVACAPSFCPVVTASGLRAVPAGLDWHTENFGEAFPEWAAMPSGPARGAWSATNIWAGRTAERMAADLLELAKEWPFDLVVCETLEFGGGLSAERLGIPHAVLQIVALPEGLDPAIIEGLERERARLGLPPDPEGAMPRRYLHLAFRPPAFQNPAVPLPLTHHSFRPAVFDRIGAEALPAWAAETRELPVIYATLGTVFNRTPGVMAAIIEGVRDEAGTLIVTVGSTVDPSSFGPQPPHVHIERYISQSLVLPMCDLVVTHGGSGTVLATLVHGLPMVLIPLTSDQPRNAERCAALGLGLVVGPDERTPAAIRAAVRAVLDDSSYSHRARDFRDDLTTLPGVEHAVALLERLAVEKRPILTEAAI